MHPTAKENMQLFFDNYLAGRHPGKVLDVGSQDINGSFKDIFKQWVYSGLDTHNGDNVDILVSDPYNWSSIENERYDLVISGNTLEHIEHDNLVLAEMLRVLKPNKLCCIIVPSAGPEHEKPDYRRYSVGSLSTLAEKTGFDVLGAYKTLRGIWQDITLVARKY